MPSPLMSTSPPPVLLLPNKCRRSLTFFNYSLVQAPTRQQRAIYIGSRICCCQRLGLSKRRLRLSGLVHNSKNNEGDNRDVAKYENGRNDNNVRGPNRSRRKLKKDKSWWRIFFLEDDGNWLGLKEDDLLDSEEEIGGLRKAEDEGEDEKELSDEEKFEAWKKRAETIIELREEEEGMRNEEERKWEDWLIADGQQASKSRDVDWTVGAGNGGFRGAGGGGGASEIGENGSFFQETGLDRLVEAATDLVFGAPEDDLLYEDRVFRFASINSAKFLAILIIIPCALDFLVHDYVMMPFLDRYVKTVPLAAQVLDVRRSQKLDMVKKLKVESAKLRFEIEIGKSPPLNDEETWLELRHKALELRDEWRIENRKAFANIWSDMVFGISIFILLYFNQRKVALLKFTGYKILNNITDTGKAFLIILITDIFLGYHSESGWQTACEIIAEHYGIEIDQAALTIFICLVPVILDACVKLWLFKFLPRLSPKVSNIFYEMRRH